MSICPYHEKLPALLAERLSEIEQSAVSQHVEECRTCQEELARLTDSVDTAKWRPIEPSTPDLQAEDCMMQRLKRSVSGRLHEASAGTRSDDWPMVAGFEVLSELGHGSSGVVYRSRRLSDHRIVALKLLRLRPNAAPDALMKFRTDTTALTRLQHPNIVQIVNVGDFAGQPYLVAELVSGSSLAQHLRGTPQPVRPAAQLIETLARAVHAAHGNGVFHRDLRPPNILLQYTGQAAADALYTAVPKIADFGLSACLGDSDSTPAMPNYLAPEQVMVPRQPVGAAVDVYALGAILYELLTGRPPFVGQTPLAIVLQVLHNEPVPVTRLQPYVPKALETICLKCLRKDPRRRYGSALDLADDLQRFRRDEPIRARSASPAEKAWAWARRHPLPAGLLAAGLLAPLVALLTVSLLSARLVRSIALESAIQQAEVLEVATHEYSRNVQRVTDAKYPVNTTVPPTPGTVPLSLPATFLHDIGEQLAHTSRTGVKLRQYSDFPFPWRNNGGPRDQFERSALERFRASKGQQTVHEFTEIDGRRVVRYAQARIMDRTCVHCHNTHPQSPRTDWHEGDVRGALVIIRPLDQDEARVNDAWKLALILGAALSGLLLGASLLGIWFGRQRSPVV
jgi:hypothetical protein